MEVYQYMEFILFESMHSDMETLHLFMLIAQLILLCMIMTYLGILRNHSILLVYYHYQLLSL